MATFMRKNLILILSYLNSSQQYVPKHLRKRGDSEVTGNTNQFISFVSVYVNIWYLSPS